MNKKRILSLLLAAVCIGGCAGCNGKTADNGEMPTLKYYVPGDPQSDLASVNEALNEMTVEKIGAKIDLEFIDWSAWKEKTNLMFASNEPFDVMSGYTIELRDMYENGTALDLTGLLDKDAKALKESLPDYMWKAASIEDGIYCVPNMQIEASNNAVGVRKDLAEKYNFDIDSVDSVMDLEPLWIAVRDNEPSLYPFKMDGSRFFNADALERYNLKDVKTENSSAFCSVVSISWDDNSIQPIYEQLDSKAGAKLAYECAQKGYFRKDIATVTDDSADVASGRYATIPGWYKPGIEAEYKNKTGYDYEWKMISEPYITEKTPLATNTFISAETKYPQKAIEFVELLNTDKDVYNLLCFGIEGKHYKWADEDHIQCDENGGYLPNSSWVFGNQFNAYPQVGQDKDVWEQTKKLNDEAAVSPFMGAVFDTSSVTLEIAQLTKVREKYLIARMDKGTADPDTYWDEFTNELKQAGIDKVVEECKKQVDEFLSNK